MNALPVPNRCLLKEVLKLARKLYDHKTSNGFDKEGSVAAMVYGWITKQTSKQIKTYPMLGYVIEKYHTLNDVPVVGIYFDKNFDFQIGKKDIVPT